MSKKIGILTYHDSDNYGSVLQAYALNRALLNRGHQAYIVDFRKPEVKRLYHILKWPKNKFECITDLYHVMHLGALKQRKARFELFRKEYLCLSAEQYQTSDRLAELDADLYICGSDQIWNTEIVDFDPAYLLHFAKNEQKISYAASGVFPRMSDEKLVALTERVKDFKAISVREESARERIENVLHREIKTTLDPVFLLGREEWERICRPIENAGEYVLCYFAGGVLGEFEKYTRKIAQELGCKRIIVMPEWRNAFRPGEMAYDSGPVEFLSLIKGAKVICTNSFHGTAFSIIFNKPFVVGMHVPFADERIRTILEMCGLTHREIDAKEPKLENVLQVDFAYANTVLQKRCREDFTWLCNAIEESAE